MKEKFNNLWDLYKMLSSTDLEIRLLAVSLIKEDPDFNWIYTKAGDFAHWIPAYDEEYFSLFGITDINIIMLHRVRLVIADELNKNGRIN